MPAPLPARTGSLPMKKGNYAKSKYERCGPTSCKPRCCRAVKMLVLLLVSYTASLKLCREFGSIGSIDNRHQSNLPKKQQNNNHTASSSSPSSKMAAGATRANRENGVAGCPR